LTDPRLLDVIGMRASFCVDCLNNRNIEGKTHCIIKAKWDSKKQMYYRKCQFKDRKKKVNAKK
jgi:hypothetical protein